MSTFWLLYRNSVKWLSLGCARAIYCCAKSVQNHIKLWYVVLSGPSPQAVLAFHVNLVKSLWEKWVEGEGMILKTFCTLAHPRPSWWISDNFKTPVPNFQVVHIKKALEKIRWTCQSTLLLFRTCFKNMRNFFFFLF